jgi:hypothetical protein
LPSSFLDRPPFFSRWEPILVSSSFVFLAKPHFL